MIIRAITDNDLYKFTMQNAVVKLFPRAKVRYAFINRAKTPFPEGFAEALQKEIQNMGQLNLSLEEKRFLQKRCDYLDPTYLDFLQGYRFDPSEVGIIQQDSDLQISIEGYWYRTILWEVPLMAMISELYFKMTGQEAIAETEAIARVQKKAERFRSKAVRIADFGTRRRFSFENHDRVVKALLNYGGDTFTGTSNVYLALCHDTKPIGTHAHEWFMFHAAKYGFKMANKVALDNWVKVYRGDLGIALSDTFTTEVFFDAFDTKLAKLFDGVRHDSGDPLDFADKTIAYYKKLRIDPQSKSIVFSDGLNPDMVDKIADHCRDRVKISFGIGTNLTNDVGVKPLNMVIKIISAQPEGKNWIPTIKLSDNKGKHTGDAKMISLCKLFLNIDEQ